MRLSRHIALSWQMFKTKQDFLYLNIIRCGGTASNKAVTHKRPIEARVSIDIFSRENVTFGNMTISETIRAIAVLRICSLPGFADNATQISKVSRKLLGRRLFSRLMRWTAYGQFVAGDKIAEIQRTAERLRQCNVLQMLAVPIEDEIEGAEIFGEELYNDNAARVLSCIEISRDTRLPEKSSLMQVKLTALINYEALIEFSRILKEQDVKCSDLAAWMESGCNSTKLSSLIPTLPPHQIAELAAGVRRLLRIAHHADKNNVKIMVDAEYSWINPALQRISIALMRNFNKERSLVYKTYQAYMKETRELMHAHAKECENAGVYFAFKLVRGAYLLPETQKHGSHPPFLCDSWEKTNENYNACVRDAIEFDPNSTEIVFATHNEESVRLAAELLREREKDVETTPNVSFGQLYGMGDYMSFTLGRMGYKVYKSVPYGTVEDTLPYLCRRAKENTLFLSGIRKEMDMLKMGLALQIRRKFASN